MPSRSFRIFILVVAELLCSVVASSERRLGNSKRSGFAESESFRQQVLNQDRKLTLETCAERMMSNDEFLECVRDDNFYTEDCGGALLQRTSDWCNLDEKEVCCGDSVSCCEVSAAGKAVGTLLFLFIVLSLIICSCACCRYVNTVSKQRFIIGIMYAVPIGKSPIPSTHATIFLTLHNSVQMLPSLPLLVLC